MKRVIQCGALLALAATCSTAGCSAPGAVNLAAAISRAGATSSPATSQAGPGEPAGPVGGPQLGSSGVVVNYPPTPLPRLPNVIASSFVVADAGSGQVLAAKDAHGRFLPASTLKVLTAVALLPVLSPDARTVASRDATATVPNVAGLVAGQSYKISDLFTALLTISANDAAIALAEAPGSYARGIALMNAAATRLQARDTRAVDPNGLDAPGQLTSAYDLALIARQALTMPDFMRYDQVQSAPFLVKPGHSETLYNQNTLLTKYPGGIGGKIGWTSAAGATYIGLARRGGVTLIATLMHCPSLTEITSAEKLLDWGFAVNGKVRPAGMLVPPVPAARRASPVRLSATRPAGTATASSGNSAGGPALIAIGFTAAAAATIGLGLAVTRRARARRAR
jgi:D-alanyl-D-alanine carboxypeptidase (penicillin-binding protein 5/6)